MPHHNRAILADIGLQKLDPKKAYKETTKKGLFLDKSKHSKEEKQEEETSSVFYDLKEKDQLEVSNLEASFEDKQASELEQDSEQVSEKPSLQEDGKETQAPVEMEAVKTLEQKKVSKKKTKSYS